MTTEPKLTEAQAIEMWNQAQKSAPATFIKIFRERGLIAEEPDMVTAEFQKLWEEWDGEDFRDLALAALKRGMELAPRKELTREWVANAVRDAGFIHYGEGITRLHAALTEALQ